MALESKCVQGSDLQGKWWLLDVSPEACKFMNVSLFHYFSLATDMFGGGKLQ